MELGEPDESGRRKPIPIKGCEFELEVDVAILAMRAGRKAASAINDYLKWKHWASKA
jgi:NADPH-dependent glutamate synthase beta subunit-like oxidoreductase